MCQALGALLQSAPVFLEPLALTVLSKMCLKWGSKTPELRGLIRECTRTGNNVAPSSWESSGGDKGKRTDLHVRGREKE